MHNPNDLSIRGRAITYAKKHGVKLRMEAELEDTDRLVAANEAHWKNVLNFAHGPFSLLERARESAYDLVDPPITQWSVVELFGPNFDQPERADGERYGELWVVPSERADEFAEAKDADDHQIVDTYGYENEENS
jgi:hypothetical protein